MTGVWTRETGAWIRDGPSSGPHGPPSGAKRVLDRPASGEKEKSGPASGTDRPASGSAAAGVVQADGIVPLWSEARRVVWDACAGSGSGEKEKNWPASGEDDRPAARAKVEVDAKVEGEFLVAVVAAFSPRCVSSLKSSFATVV